jgi:hypothetical protein
MMIEQDGQLPLVQGGVPSADSSASPAAKHWRDFVAVHPAAALFPMMSGEEMDALAEDIAKHRLRQGVVLWTPEQPSPEPPKEVYLLDGRNRLEATEQGIADPNERHEAIRRALRIRSPGTYPDDSGCAVLLYGDNTDPYEFVVSANLHRRHLTREQKREVTKKLLRANPARSDNATAKLAMVSDKTVAAVRRELEATSEVPKLDKKTGADGKIRPARRSTLQKESKPKAPATQLRDRAISDFSKILHQCPADTLNDLTRLLRGEQARIAEIPLEKRIVFASAYVQVLSVNLDDLSPDYGSAQ